MGIDILKEGGNRSESSTSGAKILGAFLPAFVVAAIYILIFLAIRNNLRKVYAPRTFLGTVPEKDRTPAASQEQDWWFKDFRKLTDAFVLQHNSLDSYLFLRFLKFIIWVCLAGVCLTWPILLPINATGGGRADQLDKLSFSNIAKNDHLWAHTVVAWVFFLGILFAIAFERLQLIGIRQACYLNESYASRLSAKTVLFLNVPHEALRPENLQQYFGDHAERSWPVKDAGDLDDLIEKRNNAAHSLESAEYDMIIQAVKRGKKVTQNANRVDDTDSGEQPLVPKAYRPTTRKPPVFGRKFDCIESARNQVVELVDQISARRSTTGRSIPGESAVFVAFSNQEAAHRGYQEISFTKQLPLEDRYLGVQPKEVLWKNIQLPKPLRLSKASSALAFVVAFTIFFSIPVGIIGTWSNAKELADRVEWLSWLDRLPDWILGLITGLIPPFLTSWLISYVPKLFRHIAKLSGEPTVPQAELKAQAWYMVFQIVQIFLVTTLSSGTAAVVTKIINDPASAPELLAEGLPKASTFYLTYFILQGTTSAAKNLLDYSELFEYWFYEYFWNKTPREKFQTYAQMRGTPWAAWYPKFTNFLIIAIAYACIQPLIIGFAAIGVFIYYLSYRYSLLYVRQTKVDTKGEAYNRALKQMPAGLYLAELCLIGLFGARKAAVQTTLVLVLLVITAVANLLLDRVLRPLELYLGVDKWTEQESLLTEDHHTDRNDEAAPHATSHEVRLGIKKLPYPLPRRLSDLFDSIISAARERASSVLLESRSASNDPVELDEDDIARAYLAPSFTSKSPKLWIPKDKLGVSKEEIDHNKAVGIETIDDAAEIDEDGRLHWDHNFENVPIFSELKVI